MCLEIRLPACHPERSEESRIGGLRSFAALRMTLPVLIVNIHQDGGGIPFPIRLRCVIFCGTCMIVVYDPVIYYPVWMLNYRKQIMKAHPKNWQHNVNLADSNSSQLPPNLPPYPPTYPNPEFPNRPQKPGVFNRKVTLPQWICSIMESFHRAGLSQAILFCKHPGAITKPSLAGNHFIIAVPQIIYGIWDFD